MDTDAFLSQLFANWADRDWYDIDGGDFQDMAHRHGLLEKYVVTQEQYDAGEAPDDCEPGDLAFRFSPGLKAAVERAKGARQ